MPRRKSKVSRDLTDQPSATVIQSRLQELRERMLSRITDKRVDDIMDAVLRRAEIGDHQAATFVLGNIIGTPFRASEPAPITVNQHGETNQAIIGSASTNQHEQIESDGELIELPEPEPYKSLDMHAVEKELTKPKKRSRIRA